MDIFERAVRRKLRFKTDSGEFSVEDIWELDLESTKGRPSLNSIAAELDKKLQQPGTFSFTPGASSPERVENELRFAIVKHVGEFKLARQSAAAQAAEKSLKRKRLMEELAKRNEQELGTASKEDILKELDALDVEADPEEV